jgi:hypothetical protein
VALQPKTSDDAAVHVLVGASEGDGFDVEAGFLADFAAEAVFDETVYRQQIRGNSGEAPRRWTRSSPDSPPARCHQLVTHSAAKPLSEDRRGTLSWEPPIGIEPMTYSLRVNRSAD